MLIDRSGRKINYLRLSVTDRCNLGCRYCIPPGGYEKLARKQLLSFEEIIHLVKIFRELGIKKVRLTGGEPLVRKNIVELVSQLSKEIPKLVLTTNGQLLVRFAEPLKLSGLKGVNISLDTLKPERFRWLTSGGELSLTLNGIEAALSCGLTPVKINVVVVRNFNLDEVVELARLTINKNIWVRFIELMPFFNNLNGWHATSYSDLLVPEGEIKHKLEQEFGKLYKVEISTQDGVPQGPAKYYQLADSGIVGFISPMTEVFCCSCNRLRLTATGKLLLCLFGEPVLDLKAALSLCDGDTLKSLIIDAVYNKKPKHNRLYKNYYTMCQVGG